MINCFLDPCTSLPCDVKHGKAGVLLEVMHSNRSSLTSIKKIGQHSCMVHFYFSLRFDVSLTNRLSEDAMASWIWFISLPSIVSPCVLLRRKKKNQSRQLVCISEIPSLFGRSLHKASFFSSLLYSASFMKGNMAL